MQRTESMTVAQQLAVELSRPGHLAPLPEVAMEAMRLADDPRTGSDDLVKVISSDAALSARVLKIVNSAFYGARTPVSSIASAVRVLGFAAIKNIALAASLTRTFRGVSLGTFDPRALWTHSVAVATAARLLAARLPGIDSSDAFLAGLMHDIGVIVELQLSREHFGNVLKDVANDATLTFRAAELRHFGATHEAYGQALAIAWNFPLALQQVCGFHHNPELSVPEARTITTIVHIADILAAQASLGYCRTVETATVDAALLGAVGLDATHIESILQLLPAQLADALPSLGAG